MEFDKSLQPEYCFGVEIEEYNRKERMREIVQRDCSKIIDGKCSVFPDPCEKMGVDRGGFLGCAFSPLESVADEDAGKIRVGQQKQARRR